MRFFTSILIIVAIVLAGGYGYRRRQQFTEQRYIIKSQQTIITQLQSLSHLTTAQMTVSKVIEGKRNFTDLFPGTTLDNSIRSILFDDALIMTIEGKVNAGIDLSAIATGDVAIIKGSQGGIDHITITLPIAEIFDVYLTDNTKPFERKLGILSKGNQELETKMRNDALVALRQEALDKGILKLAQDNARIALLSLLGKVGFTQLELSFVQKL